MARETKTAKVFPAEPTNIAAEAGKWRRINEAESAEANIGNIHADSTGTPETSKGLTITTAGGKGQKTEMLFQVGGAFGWPTLAAGECVKKVVLWVRSKDSTVALGLKFGFVGFGETIEVSNSEAKWRKIEVPPGELWRFATTARREAIKMFLEDGGTITLSVYEVYIELTTETETSRRMRGILEGSNANAKAESNAEKKASCVAENSYANVGDCAVVTVIANQEAAPTEITDGLGNTYHRDASETDANGHNVSIWSAAIGTTGKPTFVVTVGAEKVKICAQADEFSAFVVGAEGGVQATAAAQGEGTAVSGANVATRAGKGDLTIAAAVQTQTPESAEEPLVKAPMESIGQPVRFGVTPNAVSGREGYTTPAIGEEVKPEFTLTKSNKWGTVTVDYKVLSGGVEIPLQAATATSSASLALHAPTQVPLGAATAVSSASLAMAAATQIPVLAAVAGSSASLALMAATTVPVQPAVAASSGSLALTVPTQIPLGVASASSSGSLVLTAPTQVVLVAAVASSRASMTLSAPTLVVPGVASASSSASLVVQVLAIVPLQAAVAVSSASLALRAATQIPVEPASASSSGSLGLRAATQIPLEGATASSSATMTFTTSMEVPLQPATASSSATLALRAATVVPVDAASATSSAECTISFRAPPIGSVFATAGSTVWIPAVAGTVVKIPAAAGARPEVYSSGGSIA